MSLLSALFLSACSQNGQAKSTADNAKNSTTQSTTKSDSTAKNTDPAHQAVHTALQANLDKAGIEATVASVSPIDMPDMYLAKMDGLPAVFTDKTGTYIFQGDLIKLGGQEAVSLSDVARASIAKDTLDGVDKSEMIIFPAKGQTKSHIYVFTDPTCHYCRILHKDRDAITSAGIEIRYLAWPRGNDLKPIADAVWCSKDRNTALTDAKNDKAPKAATCDNPVAKHMALGASLGVSGTPAVYTANGEQIGGYLPPKQLIELALSK